MTDERLVIVAIPPLVTLSLAQKKQKGSPLEEQEVLEIRIRQFSHSICESCAPLAAPVSARHLESLRLIRV